MTARTYAAALLFLGLSCGLPDRVSAQTGPNAPREPAASGAIVVPPPTGDGEMMQKAPPAAVDPQMPTPPPAAGKDARPDTTRPEPMPAPLPDGAKKPPKPS
jgi:hypothetical protein